MRLGKKQRALLLAFPSRVIENMPHETKYDSLIQLKLLQPLPRHGLTITTPGMVVRTLLREEQKRDHTCSKCGNKDTYCRKMQGKIRAICGNCGKWWTPHTPEPKRKK